MCQDVLSPLEAAVFDVLKSYLDNDLGASLWCRSILCETGGAQVGSNERRASQQLATEATLGPEITV